MSELEDDDDRLVREQYEDLVGAIEKIEKLKEWNMRLKADLAYYKELHIAECEYCYDEDDDHELAKAAYTKREEDD